ncbi:hypothetical protein [Halorubrum sp. AJ67]|uniref:hypothetical protein n=1 Tax=Halorubrum sp. AJ67 TaxID=1173487 RepID=UPI0003DBC3EE|nr:hypothetical protein [Halorubrum sp. AJ67]CDK38042.1 putative membrane protein [Halorubrum sp. AJ67]
MPTLPLAFSTPLQVPLMLSLGIGPLQLMVLVLLLFSSTGLFIALSKQMSGGKALGSAAGLYVLMAGWTFLIL